MLIVLFALVASSCGGSDEATDAADAGDASPTVAATGDDGGDSDDAASELPDPLTVVIAQERDCAHTAADLAGDGTPAAADVELPPAEKPPVDDEFLVEVDELISTDLIVGTGEEAVSGSIVDMQYVGVLAIDGTEFDASWNRGAVPFNVRLGQGAVIAGWDEGIVGMKVGGRRVLQIPSAMAYGDRSQGDVIAADSDLVFIVDLVAITPAPEPAPPIDGDNLGAFDTLNVIDLVEGDGCVAELATSCR